jgi:hypothetical protein
VKLPLLGELTTKLTEFEVASVSFVTLPVITDMRAVTGLLNKAAGTTAVS